MLYPSQWQIRCVTCGRTRPAEDAGIVRIAPALRKYTLAWCSACRWLRFAAIEPMVQAPPEVREATGH